MPNLLWAEGGAFAGGFNRRPFSFQHALQDDPLFTLPRLAAVAEAILSGPNPAFFTHRDGSGTPGSELLRPPRERVAAAVSRLDRDPQSWIKLTRVQDADPEYGRLLWRIIDDIGRLTGLPIRNDVTWMTATVFLGAANTLTPYHIDHESNFLFQIAGDKEVHLFDPSDRSILSEEEIEKFYLGDSSAAKYRSHYEERASIWQLSPGRGVHQPPLAPHWVKNGAKTSIAVSIAFGMRTLDVQARVYQVNYYLRKLGIVPTPLGHSRWQDGLKIAGLGLVSSRHPVTDREHVGSGIDRLAQPLRLAKRLALQAREYLSGRRPS